MLDAPPALHAPDVFARTGRAALLAGDHAVEFRPDDRRPDAEPTWIYLGNYCTVRHESDGPDADPLPARALEGRRVRVEIRDGYRKVVTILGGANPRDYDLAVAAAGLMADAPGGGRSPDDALVSAGLGAARYATREAAQGVLTRRGLDAVPALVRGLGSRDAEVRVRCGAALGTIRTGEE